VNQVYNNSIPDYKTVCDTAENFSEQYPFAEVSVIGKSHLGRDIFALQIGGGSKILMAGGFHSLEWITSSLMLRFFEDLCICKEKNKSFADMDIAERLDSRGITIIPQVNPDGIELILNGAQTLGEMRQRAAEISGGNFKSWQANAKGVDINHNFDAGWDILHQMEQAQGIKSFAPGQFGGEFPESEPETKAICDLCRQNDFRHALAFHSQGEEIFWHYGQNTPERAHLMAQVFAASSGYKPSHPDGLASHGGFKDWFIEYFGKPGFTIEIGRGENPLPFEQLGAIYAKIKEMLALAVII